MATNKIQGITIELKGDTSGLQSSLQNVNKEIGSTQKELSQVERLLKFDPTNTELLAQKQELLAKAADLSAEKVKTLGQMQEALNKEQADGADIGPEAFRALQREVIATEQKMEKYSTTAEDAGDASEDAAGKTEALGGGFSKAQIAAAAAAAAFAAVSAALVKVGKDMVQFTKEGAAYADTILTDSTVTGIAADKLQSYHYAAELVDVSVDTLSGSMTKNIKNMKSAADGSKSMAANYAALGVSVTNADGSLRDGETVYWELIDALGKVENETERDALAMSLLGKSAKDLNPLIEQGSGRMRELAAEAAAVGYVLTDDQLAAYGALDDQLQYLAVNAQAAKNAIGLALLPVLTDLAEAGAEFLGKFSKAIIDANGDMDKMAESIGALLPEVLDAIGQYLPALVALVAELIKAMGQAIVDNLPAIAEKVPEVIMTIVNGIANNLPAIIQAAARIIISLAEGLIKALPNLVVQAATIVPTIAEALLNELTRIIEVGRRLVEGLWEGIKDRISWIKDKIVNFGESIISSIEDVFGVHSPAKTTEYVGQMLAAGLTKGWDERIDGVLGGINASLAGFGSPQMAASLTAGGSAPVAAAPSVTNVTNVHNTADARPIELTLNLDGQAFARATWNANQIESVRRGVSLAGV